MFADYYVIKNLQNLRISKIKSSNQRSYIWLELLDASTSTKWKNSFFIFLKLKSTS